MAESALRQLVPQSAEPFVRSYNPFNPAFRETIRATASDLLGGRAIGGTPSQRYRAQLADLLTGSVDFAPGVSDAVAVSDTVQAARGGDYGTAAILGGATMLGMVPVIGDSASRAIREGLDMSQAARMQRAREQGFDVDNILYHGTDQEFNQFNVEGRGKTAGSGAFFTDNPKLAETYLSLRGGRILPVVARKSDFPVVRVIPYEDGEIPNWSEISRANDPIIEYPDGTQDNLFDVFGLDDVTSTDEIAAIAREKGFPGITIEGIRDAGPNSHVYNAKEYLSKKYGINVADDFSNVSGSQFAEARQYVENLYQQPSSITAIFDPSRVRSINAAFDPSKRNSANLMAGVGGAAVGLSALNQLVPRNEERRPD